eukprot:TRINITY_DN1892_c0_g1_i1.p1 TRINITY_DN1892_c0_g1~~TRINITY_DN1892_c0_g1_i1.p1  ORF type:complete len:102 (+),score=12.14 TRINITY_DN1892_c0_g1_i1:99-404(+)
MATPYEVEKKKNLSECLGRVAKQGTIGAIIFGAFSSAFTYAAFKKSLWVQKRLRVNHGILFVTGIMTAGMWIYGEHALEDCIHEQTTERMKDLQAQGTKFF